MRWMIVSDIHGSEYYCNKIMEVAKREKADRILLLGDILYHGPRNDLPKGYAPKAVLELLNSVKESLVCVRGNCEAEVDQMVLEFPVMADYAILECGNNIIYATHGHKYNIDNMPPLKKGDVLLYGHTHVPMKKNVDGIQVLNPGSVSMPKQDSHHGYMTYEKGCFEWKDIETGELKDSLSLEA